MCIFPFPKRWCEVRGTALRRTSARELVGGTGRPYGAEFRLGEPDWLAAARGHERYTQTGGASMCGRDFRYNALLLKRDQALQLKKQPTPVGVATYFTGNPGNPTVNPYKRLMMHVSLA